MSSKIVLITGTSSGFGNLLSRKLATLGYKVYASMRDIEGKNSASAEALRNFHNNINVIEIDVTDELQVSYGVSISLCFIEKGWFCFEKSTGKKTSSRNGMYYPR